MILTFLKWDSHFFGKKIGRLDVTTNEIEDMTEFVIEEAEKGKYNLIYIFCPDNFRINDNSFLLVDRKIKYRCSDFFGRPSTSKVTAYIDEQPTPELINLVLRSGHYSRFKIDPGFSLIEYEKFYTTWLINSLNGSIADKVFVYKDDEKINGFITIKIDGAIATIGLLAVDPDHQGRNIGTCLLDQVKNFITGKSIQHLDVTTQHNNNAACKFYEKNDFTISLSQNIYHYWRK
jgi:dTDP-4-amino-4,6-dideoxy-D-galactose acyltransferase